MKSIIVNNPERCDLIWFPGNFGISQKPSILTVHDVLWITKCFEENLMKKGLRILYFILSYCSAKIIVVPSVTVYNKIKLAFPYLNSNKMKVIKNGENFIAPKTRKIINKVKSKIKDSFLLCIANKMLHKGVDDLLDAYDNAVHLPLILIGNYSAEQLVKASQKNVRVIRYVSQRQLFCLYNKMVGLVVPSLDEGYGLPGCYCRQLGKPLLVRQIDTFQEIYGNYPVYFNSKDDLKNKLRKFYELKKFTKEKVRTWKQCAADYDNLINATFK